MFLSTVGIYLQVHMVSQPRRPTSKSVLPYSKPQPIKQNHEIGGGQDQKPLSEKTDTIPRTNSEEKTTQ
jgi:hypothetical protein